MKIYDCLPTTGQYHGWRECNVCLKLMLYTRKDVTGLVTVTMQANFISEIEINTWPEPNKSHIQTNVGYRMCYLNCSYTVKSTIKLSKRICVSFRCMLFATLYAFNCLQSVRVYTNSCTISCVWPLTRSKFLRCIFYAVHFTWLWHRLRLHGLRVYIIAYGGPIKHV